MTLQSALTACCLMLIGAGLYFIPDAVAESVRGTVTDILRPGYQLVHVSLHTLIRRESAVAGQDASVEIAELQAALVEEQERARALETQLAMLTERMGADQQVPARRSQPSRLITRSLVDVAVLGDTLADQWRAGKLLDLGAKNGLRENEQVMAPRKTQKQLLDQGEGAEISTEDAMLLGRCVIGKVEHVGRWTSTFQLVTDANYRGRAQLIREASNGSYVFEAHGILKGQGGPLCRLDGIPAESSVRVGDAVYTADRDGTQPIPLYYGKVIEARLETDDREWTVLVKPVDVPNPLTTVHVLRSAVNLERVVAK